MKSPVFHLFVYFYSFLLLLLNFLLNFNHINSTLLLSFYVYYYMCVYNSSVILSFLLNFVAFLIELIFWAYDTSLLSFSLCYSFYKIFLLLLISFFFYFVVVVDVDGFKKFCVSLSIIATATKHIIICQPIMKLTFQISWFDGKFKICSIAQQYFPHYYFWFWIRKMNSSLIVHNFITIQFYTSKHAPLSCFFLVFFRMKYAVSRFQNCFLICNSRNDLSYTKPMIFLILLLQPG